MSQIDPSLIENAELNGPQRTKHIHTAAKKHCAICPSCNINIIAIRRRCGKGVEVIDNPCSVCMKEQAGDAKSLLHSLDQKIKCEELRAQVSEGDLRDNCQTLADRLKKLKKELEENMTSEVAAQISRKLGKGVLKSLQDEIKEESQARIDALDSKVSALEDTQLETAAVVNQLQQDLKLVNSCLRENATKNSSIVGQLKEVVGILLQDFVYVRSQLYQDKAALSVQDASECH